MTRDSKESLLTEVKVKVLAVELTDLYCRYLITYVSISNGTIACDWIDIDVAGWIWSLVVVCSFLGIYILLGVSGWQLYYIEEKEVSLVDGLWHCFAVLCLVSKLPHEGESGALMHLEKSVVAAEPMTCWQYHKWEEIGMATIKKISLKVMEEERQHRIALTTAVS